MSDVVVVHAVEQDQRGDGIWGIFSSAKKARKALKREGLAVWDPWEHHADDPKREIPRRPNERTMGFYTLDYRLTRKR